LHISIPLIVHSISALVLSRFDQILIDHFVGRSATGVYSLAYRIGDVSTMLWFAANSVWVVWFYKHMKDGEYLLIRQRASQYVLSFASITALLMIVGPTILRILAPEAYWPASNLVPVVMLGGFFTVLYSIYANVEFYQKKTGYTPVATAFAAGVNIILNIILLPRFGYQIAAWTTVASYACFFITHATIVIFRLRQGHLFDFGLLAGTGIAMVVLASLIYFAAA
jgi:O-antigen/teichoic acid export membrane protein